ncbi:GAF domain-containing protein [Nocardia transvalensis]|uniref:GAF domain-containing protein n=1 Tax=Nocardia transvalensis TaxID=37333 RepID=A0A7W9UH03_9NOCA|nr:GAF domain-containing protein [Nocardia transvalensis]MBB5912676.1 GAF domain-containing protein [Nocardia transvalensis]
MAVDYAAHCRRLLREVAAGRVTLRLADDTGFPALVAEECAPGVPSMRTATAVNPADFPTYRHLVETGDLLVQTDTRTHPIRPPDSLIDELRVYAQILAPIRRGGATVGTISVHIQDHPRRFSESDIAAVRACRDRIEAALAG